MNTNRTEVLLEKWKSENSKNLNAGIKLFPKHIREKLDLSIYSLNILEEHILNVFTLDSLPSLQTDKMLDFCVRYIGEVLIKNLTTAYWDINIEKVNGKKKYLPIISGLIVSVTPITEIKRTLYFNTKGTLYKNINGEVQENGGYTYVYDNKNVCFETYENFILIGQFSNFDLDNFIDRVKRTFSSKEFVIEVEGEIIYIKIKNWVVKLSINESSSVLQESQEMAEMIQDSEKRKQISTCSKRIEMIATEDLNMDYFNEHLYILETVQEFTDVFIFNPHSGFM
ncbi:hypothetical protein [Emticicia sp. W12TSBA100-4]|uniref:hypothetical protein n=1 Tax=Emticicia sp. W12TSBA100-4 TaxID=3160965 RepID=UPI0033060FE9